MQDINSNESQEFELENFASTSNEPEQPDVKKSDASTNTDQNSIISLLCRICYDDTLDEPVISPCLCKGTIGFVHKSCLERWLADSNTSKCDLCNKKFVTERVTKYTVGRSMLKWLRFPSKNFVFPIRDVRTDLLSCFFALLVSLIIIYICLYSADYYNRGKYVSIPAARWTSISILIMGLILITGLHIWIYLILKYHCRVWYFWWQRETIVKLHIGEEVPEPDSDTNSEAEINSTVEPDTNTVTEIDITTTPEPENFTTLEIMESTEQPQ